MKGIIFTAILALTSIVVFSQNNPITFDPGGNARGDTFGIKATETGNNTTKFSIYRRFSYDTNDFDRFVIDSGGKIGVGITSPVSKFHVYSNSSSFSSDAGVTIEEDGTGDALLQYLLTGEQRWVSGIDNSDNNKFIIGRGAAWATGKDLIIDNTGKFGLGILYPREKLDVNGSLVVQGNNLDGDDLSYLQNSHALLIGWNRSTGHGETNFISNRGAGTQGGFDFRDFDNSGNEKILMRIKGDGKIGIGTASPDAQLHVFGGNVGNGNVMASIMIGKNNGPEIQTIQQANDEDVQGLAFRVKSSGTNANPSFEAMRINSNGSIGIGTTSTFGYKLAVNGTIGSIEVKVENTSAWPDSVFENDYDLPTLEEVEQHIEEKGHLPEIPSEAEIQFHLITFME